MKANCWYGYRDVRVVEVENPKILNPRDAIVRVTSTAICGSDLHLYDGFVPTMEKGDILGHEFMGEVVEVGKAVKNLKAGDRVIVPFPIACGNCFFCKRDLWSLCENSNPNAASAEKMWGHSPCGIFGYSHLTGGYAGGQAEYVRVPFADIGPEKIENGLPDEKVLFLTDIFPTAYMAAEQANIGPGDTVAIWGCGPVGLLTIKCAFLLGAGRVIGIDRVPARLRLAKEKAGAEVLDFSKVENIVDQLKDMTGGRGPDSCIDAVGMEAEGHGVIALYDKMKAAAMQQTDRPTAIRQAILAVRNGGTVSMPGVYGGFVDKFPLGSIMNRSVTLRTGQTHVHRYKKPLLQRIEKGEIDPSFIITHEMKLSEAPKAFDMFVKKKDDCIKVVLKPG
jgi:threonine dehydrogenase-like Zn-dependent dehydrogenase